MKNKKLLGSGLLLFTALIWGTAFVAQRVGMETIEPITFNAARMLLAAVAVGLVSLLLRRKEKKSPDARSPEERKSCNKNTVSGGVFCGIFLSVASIFQQMGLVYTSAGKAGFITAMYMLLVPIIGFVFLKRKNTWLVWLAVLLGVAGMYLLCVTETFTLTHGDTLVCLCALFFSFHILCCDHFVKKGDPIRMSAIQFLTATVISGAVAAYTEEPTWAKLHSALIPILYCGIISGGVGYTLQIVAQKFTDPTIASLLMSMESVFAVIAGALLLREHMTGRELMGCAVMFLAIILVQIPLPGRKRE
ncbi:MAG: DMT family transporter [Oscillospiraceae bacterium]|nr:DMT family transporter [Oscillospiraceae bacterium]